MKTLLTGSFGYFGIYVYDYLVSKEIDVLTVGRRDKNDIRCDLSTDIPKINTNNIDTVIHAAGKAHMIPKTPVEKQAFFDVNLKGTQNLLTALTNLPQLPKYFVFISSVAVYGIETGTNITEESPLLAKDSYGLSKIQSEQLVMNWCKNKNVTCTILRLPLLVGNNPPGNLGNMVKGIKKGYYFNIGGGKARKSMVLSKDVAQFVPIIATIGGIYNLTDGEHPSFERLSNCLAKKNVANLPLKVAHVIGLIGDIVGNISPINSLKIKKLTSDLIFDDSRARKIGWNPKTVLEYLKDNQL
jgi:nucleoside-diphosphate-sugar epimerase